MSAQGKIDEKISLAPFDPQWARSYEFEVTRIRKKLNTTCINFAHIGSTAVPNMYAKPIVDIMIGIEDFSHPEQFVSKLESIGYEYLGEAGVPGRLYLRLRGKENYNIALCQYGRDIWIANLRFRDYLINNPDVAENYSAIKKKAFEEGINTLLEYSKFKHAFIEEIIRQNSVL